MKPFAIIRTALVAASLAFGAAAQAQTYDPRSLSRNERIFLQEALIWRGNYNSLTDGGWGPASINALASWRRARNLPQHDAAISIDEIAQLARETADRMTAVGWTSWQHQDLGFQISFPANLTQLQQPIRNDLLPGLNWQRSGQRGRLLLEVRVRGLDTVNTLFEGVERWIAQNGDTSLYRLSRPDRQVIAYQTPELFGYIRYDRSDRPAPNSAVGAWKGFSLQINRDVDDYPAIVNAISTSFSANMIPVRRFNSADLPNLYDALIAHTAANPGAAPRAAPPPVSQGPTQPFGVAPAPGAPSQPFAAAPAPTSPTQPFSAPSPPVAAAPRPPPARQPQQAGSGTAFVVRRDGTFLTNNHVVSGCTRMALDTGETLRVVVADPRRDLAILQNRDLNFSRELRFRRDQTIDLGEATNLFGYPYYGDGTTALNVTNGIVSALTGLNDNPLNFQLNAALQPGNSGGPVLDASGAVIGVAVARLTGGGRDAPQNVNYAIRGSIAEAFLLENGIMVEKSRATQTVSLREIAADATPLVRPVICWR